MGSRGRSIRLRIYVLVAIPLITMLGLFGYVAYTSVTNWLNLDRAPNLIDATSEPLTNFVNVLQGERRAAVVYLSQPNAANLATYRAAITASKSGADKVELAFNSSGTTSSSTADETVAINKMTMQINGMSPLRAQITAKQMAPLNALAAYTNIIAGQGAVLQAEASSITEAGPVLQGFGLIAAVNTQEDVSEQDAVLASALSSGSLTGPDRVAFSNAGGRLQDDTLNYQQLLTPAELKTYNDAFNGMAPSSIQNDLTKIQEAVPAGIPLSAMEQQGLNPVTWQLITHTWLKAANKAGTSAASTVLAANQQPAIDAKRRVIILAAVGAAGLILTLLVSLLLGRSINRRLATLRRTALTLAQEQLPSVVARLRRGETVDVAAEAPPLRVGGDEIGQVGQAIEAVRQTAIRSAIDEARVRQGVNDMFRNLARRNQSLLQRQLSVLDGMERRATDPDVLEDLFKMDHLTTRMRRHAEGLIILSGAPPGRSWSAPVKLVDVMRGAVAEVEDYARVTVSTQTRAALAGSAVTDVIHLLAELIENATSLSPPFTQVRVAGESVANGFAIEIEDRGLGMVPQRMQELNERLANPPDINPANTEQLGLFVVGQLARRHGVRVMLRPSPYGGTTAVLLIPHTLIVDDGPAAITAGDRAGAPATAGAPVYGAYAGPAGPGQANGRPGARAGAPVAGPFNVGPVNAGPIGTGPVSSGPVGSGPVGSGPVGAGATRAGGNGTGPSYPAQGAPGNSADAQGSDPSTARVPGLPNRRPESGNTGYGSGSYPAPTGNGYGATAGGNGYGPASGGTGAVPNAASSGPRGAADSSARRGGRHGTDDVPVVTGVPVGRPPTALTPEFDVFTPLRRPDQDGFPVAEAPAPNATAPRPYPDFGGSGGDGGTRPDAGSSPDSAAVGSVDGGEPAPEAGAAGDDFSGLPRRVRQANLAPQLRASAAAAARGATNVPPATAASLSDMRNTLSAMQRGWQQGRSETPQDAED